MRIVRFDVFRYAVPLARPLVLHGTPQRVREGFVVRMEDEAGHVGWGEAAPLPGFSRESADEAAAQLRAQRTVWIGRIVPDDGPGAEGGLARVLDGFRLAASVRFGVELAAWNLWAAVRGTTPAQLLRARPRTAVPLNGLLMGDPATLPAEAHRLCAAGYTAVKLKVGRRAVGDDVALVRSVHEAVGPDVALRLDANRAWSLAEAVAFAEGVVDVPCAYVEEPLADPSELPALAAACNLPLALDETLVGLDPAALSNYACAVAVVLKPTLLGGLGPALRLARRALALGMTPVVSAAFETGIGLSGLCALAAGLGEHPVPAGLDTYRWLADDLLAPRLDLEGPRVDLGTLWRPPRQVDRSRLRPLLDA